MKQKHQRTLSLIFARPIPGGIKWADIEALFVDLGGEIEERAGSRVAVGFCSDKYRSTTGRIPAPTRTKAQLQACANGWKQTE